MCISGRNTAGVFNQQPLQQLKGIVITGWPDSRDELHADLQPYWSYQDMLAVIDGIILKGIIIPHSLREQVPNQLLTNHMGIKKQSYGPSINADIEKYIKHVQHAFNFSKCSLRKE